MGRELNNNQDKPELRSSTVDTMSNDPTQPKLTSPWPDQWRLKGQKDDTTDCEDPWPDLEGMNIWNATSDTEELDPTDDAPYVTPWGLFEEPRWVTELDDAIEPEPEEDPFPLKLHYPDKDDKLKQEGELSPQTSNNIPDPREILSLQNNQRNKEVQDQRDPKNKSNDEEGTTGTSHHLT